MSVGVKEPVKGNQCCNNSKFNNKLLKCSKWKSSVYHTQSLFNTRAVFCCPWRPLAFLRGHVAHWKTTFPDCHGLLRQDNAWWHLTKMVQEWFEDHKSLKCCFRLLSLYPFNHQLHANPWRSCKWVQLIIFQKSFSKNKCFFLYSWKEYKWNQACPI